MRLQEEFIRSKTDETILLWSSASANPQLFAPSKHMFTTLKSIVPIMHSDTSCTLTNAGIQTTRHLYALPKRLLRYPQLHTVLDRFRTSFSSQEFWLWFPIRISSGFALLEVLTTEPCVLGRINKLYIRRRNIYLSKNLEYGGYLHKQKGFLTSKQYNVILMRSLPDSTGRLL